ncbi:hypothetical protein QR680_014514 [Steinernema hermaphroditum]|uniref:Peptidase S1 domain-containing protein n=1 Tax=Steinernema hermaphroditum TaxID=289476 RepID=A0AA39I939_9BILA|nr:hypothetical protein QR680_014514 [Steinernema hermaphroditum]
MGILPLLFLLVASSVAVPLEEQDDLHHSEYTRRSRSTENPVEAEFISGGQAARPGDVPNHALFLFINSEGQPESCGGSLISKKHVLTAAHCAVKAKQHVQVLVGSVNSQIVENGQRIKVKEIIDHPYYDEDTLNNDIAIVELEKEVVMKPKDRSVGIVQLARDTSSVTNGASVVVSGFGRTPNLKTAQLFLTPTDECSKAYNKTFATNQECAKGNKGGVEDGDDGGPLFVVRAGGLIQIGVASYPPPKGQNNFVFTRIDRYCNWIQVVTDGIAECK